MDNNETLNQPAQDENCATLEQEIQESPEVNAPQEAPASVAQQDVPPIQEPAQEFNYAGMFPRLIAFGIDSLLALICGAIVKLPLTIMSWFSVVDMSKALLFDYTLGDIISYIVTLAYFVLFTYCMSATPGKKLFKLKVVVMDDKSELLDIIFRESIGRFLSSLLMVGYIVGIFDGEKRCIHDMLADTRVVYDVKK